MKEERKDQAQAPTHSDFEWQSSFVVALFVGIFMDRGADPMDWLFFVGISFCLVGALVEIRRERIRKEVARGQKE